MTYEQTLEFLFSQLPAYHRIGKAAYKNNLDNTIALDNHFDHPHLKYKTIHIAGTNGKGSVSHMVASVLQEAGYRTGLYTSPHLKDFRERIKVNGIMIPEEEVISFVKRNSEIINSVKPSFFEMTVAMAFNYFAVCDIDVAVIETGLGGRLDSTNIINPVLSVITNIGHDHLDLLGDSISKIAKEKAGIIKFKTPVVVSETQIESKPVFISKAIESQSPVYFADEQYDCLLNQEIDNDGEREYIINEKGTSHQTIGKTGLTGDYQVKNIKAVYCIINRLKDIFKISNQNTIDGIRNVVKNTGLKGRWQILGYKPLIICDTGHNQEGISYVMNQIKGIPRSVLHIVVGFVSDKDLQSLLPMFPDDAVYYFTKASVPRALDEIRLKNEASEFGLSGKSYPDVITAFNAAKQNAKEDDMIFIGGSTFVVAEVI